jgi:hypothetical protein
LSPETAAAIERFLKSTRNPALVEPGEEPIALTPGSYELAVTNGRLVLAAWNGTRNISRRVTGVDSERAGRLELSIEKLGGRTGTLLLFDAARPTNQALQRHSSRLVYRELFRRSLARQFPDWKVVKLSSEADLEHSLSPAYPRALLRRGAAGIAAIGAGREAIDADGCLTYGLVWLDYLRRTESRLAVEKLALFLPEGRTQTTCSRLRHLRQAEYSVVVHSGEGFEDRLDPKDYGNLETRLDPCVTVIEPCHEKLWESLRQCPGVEFVPQRAGETSVRIRGLEFARATPQGIVYGIETKRLASASNIPELEELARLLARLRAPEAADRHNALFVRNPEAWLESEVRRNLETLEPALWPSPVYGQVPAITGCDRGVIDLLALERRGRLTVIEVKAAEDPHLPLQALDYWMRVEWHARRSEFTQNGYFPGLTVLTEAPRLFLIAPALRFHPTTEAILRFFSPEIQVERIGVGVEWQKALRVAFRARGAQPPGLRASHHNGQEYPSTSQGSDCEPQSQ